jgi:hypothetical protein
MAASSSVLGVLAVLGIMVIAALGTRNRWRPLTGDAGRTVTQFLLVVAAVLVLATIVVFALILTAPAAS